jgi:hypothetical protein
MVCFAQRRMACKVEDLRVSQLRPTMKGADMPVVAPSWDYN